MDIKMDISALLQVWLHAYYAFVFVIIQIYIHTYIGYEGISDYR